MNEFQQVKHETQYVYVFIREDLSHPQQIVQSCHAAIEASSLISPDSEHPHLVLCGVRSESELEKISARLRAYDIQFKAFREPDRNNEYTSIATEPISGNKRKIFKRYQCLRDKTAKPKLSDNQCCGNCESGCFSDNCAWSSGHCEWESDEIPNWVSRASCKDNGQFRYFADGTDCSCWKPIKEKINVVL